MSAHTRKPSRHDRRSPDRPHRPPSPSRAHRFVTRDGRVNVKRHGLRPRHPRDWYHHMLALSWPKVIGVVALAYLLVNCLFALLYLVDPHGLQGARPGSFRDAFFFSVQTLSTVGYGVISPQSFYANAVATAESLVALICFGLISGLFFSRFSRPSARVMFSHFAVIAPYEGAPTLMFRAANRRGNQILQAQIHVSLSRNERTLEGESIRRVYDLRLLRSASSFFNLTWTVRHPIDELSPLMGESSQSLCDSETEIVVLLSGTDDVFGQTVHGRFAYNHEEILYKYRFVSMFDRDEHNRPVIDFTKFDAVEPVPETGS
ncbi:MAG: ion channel [Alphaproteobacteria bacterium]|nr:ion channel [Alphaproteobacteria bacterium]